jgi:hypothetical protein
MPEAWSTAIISAGRQVLWEFTANKQHLSPEDLPNAKGGTGSGNTANDYDILQIAGGIPCSMYA